MDHEEWLFNQLKEGVNGYLIRHMYILHVNPSQYVDNKRCWAVQFLNGLEAFLFTCMLGFQSTAEWSNVQSKVYKGCMSYLLCTSSSQLTENADRKDTRLQFRKDVDPVYFVP
jgi:hypothetical protein